MRLRASFAALLCIALASCALNKDLDSRLTACVNGSNAALQQAFQKTFAPAINSKSCKNCHNGTSGSAPYAFASSSLPTAYGDSKKLSVLSSPGASRLVTKVRNEQHQCAPNCATIATEFETAIRAWAAEEQKVPSIASCQARVPAPSPNRVVTQAQVIRMADLPTNGTNRSYRFDLGLASPPVPNAGFEIQVAALSQPNEISRGSFILSSPKLGFSGTPNYRISNLQVWQERAINTAAINFEGLEAVVVGGAFNPTAGNWPFPLLSFFTQLITVRVAEGDSIGFSFDLVRTTADPFVGGAGVGGCRSLPLFNSTVAPILTARCRGCHGANGSGAFTAYPLRTGDDVCTQSLSRSNLGTPAQSRLLLRPQGLQGTHPPLGGNGLNTSDISLITAWIQDEAARSAQ